jgi:DNA-directed RNA polymerase specialized sigma subunit
MPGGKRNSNNIRREVKYMRLSNGERMLVEENMGLVGKVIKDKVRDITNIGIFTYDDLFQIGCIGLCKAAAAHMPDKGRFSTYAYMLIHNEIFSALEYATLRKNREIGERMGGVSANNVSAWVARARRFLRSDPAVAAFAEENSV